MVYVYVCVCVPSSSCRGRVSPAPSSCPELPVAQHSAPNASTRLAGRRGGREAHTGRSSPARSRQWNQTHPCWFKFFFPTSIPHAHPPLLPFAIPSYLLQGVLVSLVGALEFSHQFSQCAVGQWFVHQVLAAAHTQWSVAAVAVDTQHNMVEAVAWKLGLKADGETLEWRQPVGQVAGQHSGIKERSGPDFTVILQSEIMSPLSVGWQSYSKWHYTNGTNGN